MVGSFLWRGRVVEQDAVILGSLLVFFLPFLTTVHHIWAGVRGGRRTVGRGGLEAGLICQGLFSATLKGIRVGV